MQVLSGKYLTYLTIYEKKSAGDKYHSSSSDNYRWALVSVYEFREEDSFEVVKICNLEKGKIINRRFEMITSF